MSLTVKCGENLSSKINFVTPQCHNTDTMLGQIKVKPNSYDEETFNNITTIKTKQKKEVFVTVASDADTTGWTIQKNNDSAINLRSTSYTAPDSGQPMSLTVKCGAANFSKTINFTVVNS